MKIGLFASLRTGRYHQRLMPSTLLKMHLSRVAPKILAAIFALIAALAAPTHAQGTSSATPSARDGAVAPASTEIFPLSEVKAGMKGVAYTIYTGDKVEKVDLVVLGVLQNAIGPKQDIIVVQLLGDEAEHSGVVAGMSGSPVYFDGKLAGALSLKLGQFTKEALGGVTPISEMIDVAKDSVAPSTKTQGPSALNLMPAQPYSRVPLPAEFTRAVAAGAGASAYLEPIETPLISSGLYPETMAEFGKYFSAWGMTAMAGGTAPASPEDAKIQPGDMVGFDLVRGDLTLSSGCTVTTVVDGQVMACGHPLFGYGAVNMPLSRAHVLTTMASSLASTKIMSLGGEIGTLTQDRATAVLGKIGPGPRMIPVDVVLTTPAAEKKFHFEVIESQQLTAQLVAISAYNGIVGSTAYGEGYTLELDGSIQLQGHTPVRLSDLFAPSEQPVPGGFFVATDVMTAFSQIYSNPYEQPKIDRVDLHVTQLPERRWAKIDSAWIEKSEVRPGETIGVKVLMRPYRGAPFIQEIPITIPEQAQRGSMQLLVSDSDTLNRTVQSLGATSQGQLPGLEELIKLMNRERRNDFLYATLLQPTPTLLVEDKEMPNAPTSEINVLNQRQNPGAARVVYESTAGEWSVEMHQVIAGEHRLTITVK
jgi:hypothetical protein